MIDLGTLPGGSSHLSRAFALNNRGQVVGESLGVSVFAHAFLSDEGSMMDLGTLPTDSTVGISAEPMPSTTRGKSSA